MCGVASTRVFEQVRTPFSVQIQVIQAILDEVLSFVPEEFETFDELHEMLILIGQTATSRLLEDLAKRYPEGAEQTIREERAHFRQELGTFDRGQINAVKPLSYVRTLAQREAAALWRQITREWKLIQNHWYPICGPPRLPNAMAFLAEKFEANLAPAQLQNILCAHAVERVYEFSEFSPVGLQGGWPEREIELKLLVPRYGQAAGAEGYWFSGKMNWLLYASHESSITVGGEWLIEAIKQVWIGWEEGLYEQYPIARFHLGDYQPDS